MTSDEPLAFSEYRSFISLLNEGGHVVNLNNHQFSEFTKEITGIDLLEKYELSKGKSLEAFLSHTRRSETLPLLRALMKEWEATRRAEAGEDIKRAADTCWKQLDTLERRIIDDNIGSHLQSQGFTSEYLEQ